MNGADDVRPEHLTQESAHERTIERERAGGLDASRFRIYANKNVTIAFSPEPVTIPPGEWVTDTYRFIFPLNVSHRCQVDGVETEFLTDHFHALNPLQAHAFSQPVLDVCVLQLELSPTFFQGLAHSIYGNGGLLLENTPIQADRVAHYLVEMLLDELEHDEIGHSIMIESLATQLAIWLLRKMDLRFVDSSSKQHRHQLVVVDAIDYMKRNLAEELSVEELAKTAQLSISHFTRVFKEHTKSTPYDYLQELRLERARQLLKITPGTITEILLNSGFKNHSHFTKAFKKRYGQSPSDYRNHITE